MPTCANANGTKDYVKFLPVRGIIRPSAAAAATVEVA